MRYLIIIAFIIGTYCRVANAATCDAGYYLENGVCKHCNPSAEPFYCPGDDVRHACPTTDTDYEKLSGWTKISGSEAHHAHTGNGLGATDVSQCVGSIFFRDSHGNEIFTECLFNGESYWCDRQLWYTAGNGYYLANYYFTSFNDWYHSVKGCTNAPANAHYTGPGTPDAPDGSVKDANDCPWECDAGLGKSASGECLPLCTGGATKIHAGEHVFNLWRDRRTSPSLNIELSGDTVCYINLVPGLARATLNVIVRDTTYHVTN